MRRQTELAHDRATYALGDRIALRPVGLGALVEHHYLLAVHLRTELAESETAAGEHTVHSADHALDLVCVVVASIADAQVILAADHEQLAVGKVAEVTAEK